MICRILTAWCGSAVVILAAGLSGCDEVKVSDQDLQLIEEPDLVAAMREPTTVVIDVRKPERYRAGHLPGAINIFLPDIQASDARLAEAKRIIVYGDSPLDPLARAGGKKMLALGYSPVEVYIGGLRLWREAGREVVTEEHSGAVRPDTDGEPRSN